MMEKHKHAEFIHGWAEGREVQAWCSSQGGWLDDPEPSWAFWRLYRFKPQLVRVTKTLRYRRYITSGCFGNVPGVFCLQYDMRDKVNPEVDAGFIKWIDEDWVTVEFEQEEEVQP